MIASHHLKSALVAVSVLAPSAYSVLALAQAADPCMLIAPQSPKMMPRSGAVWRCITTP